MILSPNSWGSALAEHNDCHEPGGTATGGQFCDDDKGPSIALYRGDAREVGTFSLSKADEGALFGPGIYLTNNKRIAGDYRAKGSQDVLFRYGGSGKTTKQDVVDAYIRRNIAPYIDANGDPLPGREGMFGRELSSMVGDPEREARLTAARQKWEQEVASTVEIRKLVGNEFVVRQKGQTGVLSRYNVPKAWLDKALDAEAEISIDAARVLSNASEGRGRQLYDYATTRNEDGFLPTFRDVYQRAADSGIGVVDHQAVRKGLKGLGFKGIRYAGGMTMGGGVKHNAYVLWDEQGLKKLRAKK